MSRIAGWSRTLDFVKIGEWYSGHYINTATVSQVLLVLVMNVDGGPLYYKLLTWILYLKYGKEEQNTSMCIRGVMVGPVMTQ